MVKFCRTFADGVKHATPWDKFASGIKRDLNPAARQGGDAIRQRLRSDARAGQVFWPSRDHFPLAFVLRDGWRRESDGGSADTCG